MTDDQGSAGLRQRIAPHLTRQNGVLVLVSLAILVLVVLTQQARPNLDDSSNAFAPSFKVTGTIGKPVHLRLGTLTLGNVRLARALREGGTLGASKKAVETPGVWVLVDYTLVGARKAESMEPKLVTIDHTEYRPSRATSGLASSLSVDPGFTAKGTMAFEVPKRALSGSSVTVGADSPFGDALWDTKAVVSLGLDDGRAASLIRRAPAVVTLGSG